MSTHLLVLVGSAWFHDLPGTLPCSYYVFNVVLMHGTCTSMILLAVANFPWHIFMQSPLSNHQLTYPASNSTSRRIFSKGLHIRPRRSRLCGAHILLLTLPAWPYVPWDLPAGSKYRHRLAPGRLSLPTKAPLLTFSTKPLNPTPYPNAMYSQMVLEALLTMYPAPLHKLPQITGTNEATLLPR